MEDREPPPPPYSETDIYSPPGTIPPHSGPSGSPHPASVDAASTTSTTGDIIYTPPLTPQTTYNSNQSNFAGPTSDAATVGTLSSSTSNLNLNLNAPNPLNITNAGSSSSSQSRPIPQTPGARHYFSSRPPPLILPPNSVSPITHALVIQPDSQPGDFHYPAGDFAARDVNLQDWLTFRNFLFPEHSSAAMGQVLDRKLKEEEDSIARAAREGSAATSVTLDFTSPPPPASSGAGLGVTDGGTAARSSGYGTASPGDPPLGPVSHAQHQARGAPERASGGNNEESARALHFEDTAREWNDGFFGPRGIVIKLSVVPSTPMPGAWEPTFDPLAQAQRDPPPVSPSQLQPQQQQGQGQGHGASRRDPYQRFNPFNQRGVISFGGLRVDADGVRVGNGIVADRNGVRVGNLTIDSDGVRMGNNTLIRGAGRAGPSGQQQSGVTMMPGGTPMPHTSGMPGPMPGGMPGMPGMPGVPGLPGPSGMSPMPRGSSDPAPFHHRNRSHSISSISSASSNYSSSSESSIGSLPSPADLTPPQLPILHSRLQEWLAQAAAHRNSDNHGAIDEAEDVPTPLTRENVALLRVDLRNAASRDANLREAAEAATMRKEIKVLIAEFKSAKKRERKVRKKMKKERRLRKREERKERRGIRREDRRVRREARREARRGGVPVDGASGSREVPVNVLGRGPGGPGAVAGFGAGVGAGAGAGAGAGLPPGQGVNIALPGGQHVTVPTPNIGPIPMMLSGRGGPSPGRVGSWNWNWGPRGGPWGADNSSGNQWGPSNAATGNWGEQWGRRRTEPENSNVNNNVNHNVNNVNNNTRCTLDPGPSRSARGPSCRPRPHHHGFGHAFGRGGFGSQSCRTRDGGDNTSPVSAPAAGPGFFSGFFPGAWPGESPAPNPPFPLPGAPTSPTATAEQVAAQGTRLAAQTSAAATRSATQTSAAAIASATAASTVAVPGAFPLADLSPAGGGGAQKYHEATILESEISAKESQLAVMQESIEGLQQELQTTEVKLASEIDSTEREYAGREEEVEHERAIKESEILEREKWLSELLAGQSTSPSSLERCISDHFRSAGKAKATAADSGIDLGDVSKTSIKELETVLKAEKERLKADAKEIQKRGMDVRKEGLDRRKTVEDRIKEQRKEGAAKVMAAKTRMRGLEGEVRGMEERVRALRVEGDEEFARDIEERERRRGG